MLSFKNTAKFHEIRTTSAGGKSINVSTEDNKKVQFITNTFKFNFEKNKIIIPKDKWLDNELYDIIKDHIVKKSEIIYGKKLPIDVINEMNNDSECNDIFAKFPTFEINGETEFDGMIFDNAKKKIPLSKLKCNSNVQVILELVGIYFIPKRFGVSWKVVQIRTLPKTDLTKYSFDDFDDCEDATP